jgi:hypothetical protein
MGFALDSGQYLRPGEVVAIFAKANKPNGVQYDWEIPGFYSMEGPGRVKWTVPYNPGEYSIKVTARDSAAGVAVSKELKVKIADKNAYAEPGEYSYTVASEVSFSNIYLKESLSSDTLRFSKATDGSIRISGGPEDLEMDYEYPRSALKSDDLVSASIPPSLGGSGIGYSDFSCVGLPALIDAFPDHAANHGIHTFKKATPGGLLTVKYDEEVNRVTYLRNDDELNGEVSSLDISYQVIDGFVFPETVISTVIFHVGEISNVIETVQQFRDIEFEADGPAEVDTNSDAGEADL